ncbi:MAG: hypothetical protein MK005_02115 [Alcanivorax sp.]|nr:hypothetical protein [Alcanivorax sp.]
MAFDVHDCLLPDGQLCAELDLYVRLRGQANYAYSERTLHLGVGSTARFNTYFGAFSLRKWQRHTDLKQLRLCLDMDGEALLRVWGVNDRGGEALVKEWRATGASLGDGLVISEDLATMDHASLYVEIVALTPTRVHTVSFGTDQEASRTVGLAIVITTFNRFADIAATARRLADFLDQVNSRGVRIKAFIINNGDAIDARETEHLKVLENRNLGGAGGFARGLSEVSALSGFTHCLFMDDDAACEVTALERAHAFLSYSRDGALSIAGAMLKKERMFVQHEAGAAFDGLVRPLNSGRDLRDYAQVLANEEPVHINYGAWWFFLFPISKVRRFPFPFFVRGDDIEFSLSHDFRIITLNGVATWQEDFAAKSGPMVTYLSTRSTLVTALLHGGWGRVMMWFAASAMKSAFGLCYDRTMAQCQAASDVLAGPAFWAEHIDLSERRARLKANTRYEHPVSENAERFLDDFEFHAPEGRLARLFRMMTLNGHLLPTRLFKRLDTVSVDFALSPFTRVAFLRRAVLYKSGGRPIFLARHDKRYFFTVAWRSARLWVALLLQGPRLRQAYRRAHGDLTSEVFWKHQFGE